MANPTQPDLDSLTLEGLKRAGYPGQSAGSTLQTQAEGWVEEIKWDIWSRLQGRRLKALMATAYGVTADGVSRYALPADYESIYSLTILNGTHTGSCAAGSDTSDIELAATEDVAEDFIQGKLLLITSGTSVGACSQVASYTGTTATVSPAINASAPSENDTYMIVDRFYPLKMKELLLRDKEGNYSDKGIPEYYFPMGQANADSDETGEFELFQTPDGIYGIQIRYFVNLSLTDLGSNLMKTLYRRWQAVWIQGVIVRCLQQDRDARYPLELQKYDKMVLDLINGELYDADIQTLQARVET